MGFRSDISKNNQFYISKHRYYELKHFCLQYNEWRELYLYAKTQTLHELDDPTGYYASIMADCEYCMGLVEDAAACTDEVLGRYILKHVTTGSTYEKLRMMDSIPCGRELFYTYLRKFYWILSQEKGV